MLGLSERSVPLSQQQLYTHTYTHTGTDTDTWIGSDFYYQKSLGVRM